MKLANKKEDYLYLSALLRAREAKMLTREKAERMLDAATYEEAAKMLTDCGYKDFSEMNAGGVEQALNDRRADEFTELARMAPNAKLVDVFRMKYDYHNAKTLIKSEAEGLDRSDLMSSSGRVPTEELTQAFREDKYLGIPVVLSGAMLDAKSTLARTGNPQLADFILDRAYFEELFSDAKELDSHFLSGYAQVMIDSANLRSAVRTLRMHKDADFLRTAAIPGGSVAVERLILASVSGEGLAALFASTVLETAANYGAEAANGGPMTRFELACDNAVTEYLSNARLAGYGEEPVIAYIAGLEGEITTVRMILTGRLAGIAPDIIRERLRDLYA